MLSYALITLFSLYSLVWVRKLYKSQLRGLRLIYKVLILLALSQIFAFLILLIDILVSDLLKSKSQTFFSDFQYNYLLPICIHIFPDLAYVIVILIFYSISAAVVDTLVYDSVECYIKNYESQPQKITYMCFNILCQGLLLSTGYFSLFITMIKLTTWEAFMWDDSGFILVISSILAGAVKFPKRVQAKWNDILMNSYAIFFSLKLWIATIKYALWD